MVARRLSTLLFGVVFLVGCGSERGEKSRSVNDEENKTETSIILEAESRADVNYLSDADSDYDGLNDLEEVEDYKTDPLKEDTDGDGADDLWEVNNASNPCVYNEKFLTTLKSEEVSEYNMVSMEVEVLLDNAQIYDADIQVVEYSDNPLLSPSIAGYMGNAYSLVIEDKIDGRLFFRYNTEVYGMVNEDFKPCIYYFNEESQLLEEVSYESGGDGCVVGKVNKKGTYILLDKIEYDKIWSLKLGN